MAFPTLADFCAAGCDLNSISNEEFKSLVIQYICSGGGGGGGGGPVGGALEATQQDVLTAQQAALTELAALVAAQLAGDTQINSNLADAITELQAINTNTTNFETGQNGTLLSTTETTPGATTAGLMSVSIINVGTEPGVVDGQPFLPGESFNKEAIYDTELRRLYRVPAVSFDGTGTELRVRTFGA